MVQRTCMECWESWRLGAGLAHDRHSGIGQRGMSRGAIRTVERDPFALMNGSALRHTMDEARRRDVTADRNLALRRQLGNCPKCSSARYTERRVWRWTPTPVPGIPGLPPWRP